MPAVRAKTQRYSEDEDAYLLGYREWRNDKVSESWSQFRSRYDNKFWIDPRSSASLFRRAERLSGHRHQTLSRGREMMQHMLTIRKSSLWWTWGRIGQAFGTNAKTAYRAYKSFLERQGIDEVENEADRIRWTESEMRKLKRAHHLGQSWEQIAQRFGYEECICVAAHWIHSYGEIGSGNLHMPFHPMYFFSMREKVSIYPKRKLSITHEVEDKEKERQWEEDRREQLPLKFDSKNGTASRSDGSHSGLNAAQPVKKEFISELEHDREIVGHGLTKRKQQPHARRDIATAVTRRDSARANTFAKTITPVFKGNVPGMRMDGAKQSFNILQAHEARPPATMHRSVSNHFAPVIESRQISKTDSNINTELNEASLRMK
ncbi:hypothetical protein DSL72_005319 [Monilinia vaccinii-corymbosi]|uniref:Myb-like domain-containing protein n=1 Tax=Monilinia vaccinii-corymbosi TaxID=61207 RepID=A0A8A3PF14_9HELO|nr:hypothetical protein DSL72_005319 [Monilinia vaccinii-corymbosi]